jgi:squalene-hopene/tetraprenyl-beta-curcumene cyclase
MTTLAPAPSVSTSPQAADLPARAAHTLDLAVEALFAKLRTDRAPAAAPHALHWCAELEGDSILSSEYLLMKLILGQEHDSGPESEEFSRENPKGRVTRRTLLRIANHLRLVQRDDGTWGQYPGSPADISACVKAYLALKCFGDSPDAPHMRRARERILALGGAEACNTFSTFYLACLGQVSWDACPAIPPEIALLPRWFPFHMDKVAAWTRTMILPLALCSALRPVRDLPREHHIDELFRDQKSRIRLNQRINRHDPTHIKNFFLSCDKLLKLFTPKPDGGITPLVGEHRDRRECPEHTEKNFESHSPSSSVPSESPLRPLCTAFSGLPAWRIRSIRAAEAWILDRLRPETTEGLGAIFPPMVYLQVAFKALGYPRAHPVLVKAERDLNDFMLDEPNADPRLDHVRLQPCFSPVWDTGIALYALTEAGYTAANDERIAKVCDWLIARQVTMTGDWVRNLRPEDRSIRLGPPPHGDAAAWAFEYHNDWYPDVDDTAMVAKALHRATARGSERAVRSAPEAPVSSPPSAIRHPLSEIHSTAQRAARWILAMQNDTGAGAGGWAAFDKTKDRPWMEAIPFADHNAMQDPSCSDITGRTIESLITCGLAPDHPAITRAVEYLLRTQEPEGCWWGRWGNNYIYGTWQALGGLSHAGVPIAHPAMQRALAWIKSVQNPDGGFGESANSYLDRTLMGQGPSTASQTAWGLACLLYFIPEPETRNPEPDSLSLSDPSITRAVTWLCDHQLCEDKPPFEPAGCTGVETFDPGTDDLAPTDFVSDRSGGWSEHYFTGTGFPKVFYLRYNMYRHYFPVMSLARYVRLSHRAPITAH